jgi:hypothetical protein
MQNKLELVLKLYRSKLIVKLHGKKVKTCCQKYCKNNRNESGIIGIGLDFPVMSAYSIRGS